MRDLVPDVLHRRREVVRRPPVAAHEHDVLELLVRELDAPAHHVVPRGDALVGHAEANRALVLVGLAVGDELVGDAPAVVEPVELERHRPVPVEPEPAQRVLDLVDGLGDLAARVRVLDAQPELAAVVPREEPVEEERAHAADVEEAGRARSHADADGHRGAYRSCGAARARLRHPRLRRRARGGRRGARAARHRTRGLPRRRRAGRRRSRARCSTASRRSAGRSCSATRMRSCSRCPQDSPEPLTQGQLDKREWTLAQLEPSHLDQIRSFVPTLDVELDDGLTLRAFHGSPHSYDDVLLPETPDAQVERLLGGSRRRRARRRPHAHAVDAVRRRRALRQSRAPCAETSGVDTRSLTAARSSSGKALWQNAS